MIVSVAEQRGYMGGLALKDHQRDTMELIIKGVQRGLEDYLNRTIEPARVRERVKASNRGFLHLSNTPVIKVLSLDTNVNSLDGYQGRTVTRLDPADSLLDDLTFDIDPEYQFDRYPFSDGVNQIVPGGLSVAPNQFYYVDYVGGLNGYLDSSFKLSIMRVVAREWASNHVYTEGLRSGTPDQTEVGDARFLGWSTDELKAFDRYRRRTVIR